MISSQDLKGIFAMMPSFTTQDGNSPTATDTIDTEAVEKNVDKIINDGIDFIATTGSFGECHTLLWEEQQVLIDATVKAVRKRVPLFIGIVTVNTRETIKRMRFAEQAGADGVMCGVPHYFPSTVDNAVQFYLDIADAFPKLGIAIYHNPQLHRVTIPVAAFHKLITRPNIVAMKDIRTRDAISFMQIMNIVKGKISVFCNQTQSYPYYMFGAAGFWSVAAWMGPSPLLRLRDACVAGDFETAKQICLDMEAAYTPPGRPGDLFWRENAHKLTTNEIGYCNAGPLRPPFRIVPPEVIEQAKRNADSWISLCKKYPYPPQ